ncbi:MAG: hypothetical protein MRK02_12075 [Candidatus Scalindua sp.]|nr:hypothetical protein [Candidatus Scalindua sp.]
MQAVQYGIEMFHVRQNGSPHDKRKKSDKQKKFSRFLKNEEGEGEIPINIAQKRTGDLLRENKNAATHDKSSVSDDTCGTIIDAEV